MEVDPKSSEILRAVRRMEIKSKSYMAGGFYDEIGPAVLGGTETIPDPHFNRISIVEQEKLDQSVLSACAGQMAEGMPVFIDAPHPVSEATHEMILESGYHSTGEARSSMLLTGHDCARQGNGDIEVSILQQEMIETFLDLFLTGFETPEEIIPLAKSLFHDLVLKNCAPDNSRLYLGKYKGEPVGTLYLFFEGEEAGINMVATRKDLRGKGLATAMVRRAITDTREMGVRIVGLETMWNGAPERLYGKLGFVTIARHDVYTNISDLKYGL